MVCYQCQVLLDADPGGWAVSNRPSVAESGEGELYAIPMARKRELACDTAEQSRAGRLWEVAGQSDDRGQVKTRVRAQGMDNHMGMEEGRRADLAER